MYSKTTKAAIIAILGAILAPVVVVASSITNAGYSGRIIVTNNGTLASNVSTAFTFNATSLINAGMLSSNGSDAVMRDANGNDVPFMPGYAGSPWNMFIASIPASSAQNHYLYSHNVTGGSINYFPGAEGMNVTDNASLELLTFTTNYTFSIVGYFNLDAGTDKYLVKKGSTEYQILVGQNEAGFINGGINVITPGVFHQVSGANVTNGYHNITINATGVATSLVVDGVTLNTTATRSTVSNTANDWTFCSANATDYINSISVSINNIQQARWSWQYATTFNDTTGNGHTATPTFRTTTSNANVTANVSTYTATLAGTSINATDVGTWAITSSTPGQIPNMYTPNGTPTYFGYGVVFNIAGGINMPVATLGYIYIFLLIFAVAALVYWLTTRGGKQKGSLFASVIVALTLMIYFSVTSGIAGYTIIPVGIIALALLIKGDTNSPWG